MTLVAKGLKKIVQILDMRYLANRTDRTAVWQFLLHNLSNSTQPVFVTHATCSTTHQD